MECPFYPCFPAIVSLFCLAGGVSGISDYFPAPRDDVACGGFFVGFHWDRCRAEWDRDSFGAGAVAGDSGGEEVCGGCGGSVFWHSVAFFADDGERALWTHSHEKLVAEVDSFHLLGAFGYCGKSGADSHADDWHDCVRAGVCDWEKCAQRAFLVPHGGRLLGVLRRLGRHGWDCENPAERLSHSGIPDARHEITAPLHAKAADFSWGASAPAAAFEFHTKKDRGRLLTRPTRLSPPAEKRPPDMVVFFCFSELRLEPALQAGTCNDLYFLLCAGAPA